MNRALAAIGLLLTSLYLVFLYGIFGGATWSKIIASDPNQIGDVLAGAFGPLAILWLILGFFQQGVELRQNTRALEQQATELKASVDQQRELARVANEQLLAQQQATRDEAEKLRLAIAPKFLFVNRGHSSGAPYARYHFAVVNVGGTAVNFSIRSGDPMLENTLGSVTLFESHGERTTDIGFLDGKSRTNTRLALSYTDSRGATFTQEYLAQSDGFGILSSITAIAA